MDEVQKQEMIRYRISRADETVQEISSHLFNNYLHTAVNRIYYGIFYIVSALALNNNFTTNNHGQLMGWFNREYIKSNKIDKKYSKIYRWAFQNRQSGDYNDFISFTKDQVFEQYEEMKNFIICVKKLLI